MTTDKEKKPKHPGGRPTKYTEVDLEQVTKLCLLGVTDEEIADFLNICEATLNNWKKEYPEFLESIKNGKEYADANVAKSLYNRACGFDYDEVTFEKLDNKVNLMMSTAEGIKTEDCYKKKVVTKKVAPDTGAAFIWLKNRRSGEWRDKQEIEIKSDKFEQFVAIVLAIIKNNVHDPEVLGCIHEQIESRCSM